MDFIRYFIAFGLGSEIRIKKKIVHTDSDVKNTVKKSCRNYAISSSLVLAEIMLNLPLWSYLSFNAKLAARVGTVKLVAALVSAGPVVPPSPVDRCAAGCGGGAAPRVGPVQL